MFVCLKARRETCRAFAIRGAALGRRRSIVMGSMARVPSWVRPIAFALILPLPASAALAGDSGATFRMVAVKDCATVGADAVCLGAPLVAGASTTALDVLGDIYPELGTDGKGGRFAGAEAVEAASDPDAGNPADRAIDVAGGDMAEIAVIDGAQSAYAAVVSNGVVAVAQIKPTYQPLGRLFAATDPGGPTNGYRLLLAAPESPVVVTSSSHFNSQERYEALHILGVVGNALVDLYDGPYLYSLSEASDGCALQSHDETISDLKIQKKVHHGLADIGITVDYVASCTNGDVRRQSRKKSFAIRLGYDGARYDGDTSSLDDFNSSFTE